MNHELRWVSVWETAWPAHDAEPIAALYAEDAVGRARRHRQWAAHRAALTIIRVALGSLFHMRSPPRNAPV